MIKNFRLSIHRNSSINRIRSLLNNKRKRVDEMEEANDKANGNEDNSNTLKAQMKEKKKSKTNERLLEPIKDHFFTFQLLPDLYTLLYCSLVFKWINSDRVLLIVNKSKTGYILELFLRSFLLNSVFLDREMPVNTNTHFYNQFLKGKHNIIIANTEYSSNSPQFGKEIVDNCPIPITIIYFNSISAELLKEHSYNQNTRSIYHFIPMNAPIQTDFDLNYRQESNNGFDITEYSFDKEQMCHLRYRCEDAYHRIGKLDIKKEKTRKINVELLHSKKMEKFFEMNPKEKQNVINAIEENKVTHVRPSSSYLPSYLIHQENNVIADAIRTTYVSGRKNRRRNEKRKMEKYIEALDKGDESHKEINF